MPLVLTVLPLQAEVNKVFSPTAPVGVTDNWITELGYTKEPGDSQEL